MLDFIPDDACHFITIHLNHGVEDFNFTQYVSFIYAKIFFLKGSNFFWDFVTNFSQSREKQAQLLY